MRFQFRDSIYRLWIALIVTYTVVFLSTYSLGLVTRLESEHMVETLCRGEAPFYTVLAYVIPVIGQSLFSMAMTVQGICVSYELEQAAHGAALVAYAAMQYLYAAMLALLIAVPAADATLMLSLSIMYLMCRREGSEDARERVRALIRSSAIAYAQHAVLSVLILLLLVLLAHLMQTHH